MFEGVLKEFEGNLGEGSPIATCLLNTLNTVFNSNKAVKLIYRDSLVYEVVSWNEKQWIVPKIHV